ncbi:hypothetical protein PVAP13_2NG383903 [Panicum virgatum]|uniref:25S rRNA (uridine-N(3))-methyltransferase BMT5-like domain-containing protein n=1 Tax=Panicum virgatum TaxID=38727 RepID=A0A8T0VHG2_PANVG|nr:hypothetical protein PVAP13_2NG383903 [Panicum virgatum]
MAVGVVAPELGDPTAASLVGGDGAGGEAPLVAATKEDPPPAGGVPAVEGAPAAIAVEEEEAHKAEDKSEAEAADGVPAVEGAPAVITVEGEEETHKAEDKSEAAVAEESILIVGDGDFSFSLALATAFGSRANLVTTSLDTYDALRGKYSKAESNIMELKRLGATVLHGVDEKKMRFHADLKSSRFDRIVFNFPHAGFKGKEDDMHMVNLHKELLWGFFFNARHLVRRYGEIHVTHKTGLPYDRWDLEHLPSRSSLAMVEKVSFRKEDYPGYNQKRGDSARCDEPFDLGACCTFKFQIGDLMFARSLKKKLKKRNGKRPDSIPSLGGSNIYPGNRVTDRDNTGRMLMPPPPPYIADQRPLPRFPPNSDGMVRAPYFHQHDSFHPTASMLGPWLNALPDQGVIHQQDNFHPMASRPGPWLNAVPDQRGIRQQDSFHPMVGMPGPRLNALSDQGGIDQQDSFHPMASRPGPWLNAVPDQRGIRQRDNEMSLKREHEMHWQVMPGGKA